jgi:hypothetical protein
MVSMLVFRPNSNLSMTGMKNASEHTRNAATVERELLRPVTIQVMAIPRVMPGMAALARRPQVKGVFSQRTIESSRTPPRRNLTDERVSGPISCSTLCTTRYAEPPRTDVPTTMRRAEEGVTQRSYCENYQVV